MGLLDRLLGRVDGKSRRDFHRDAEARERAIRGLSLIDARSRMERLLADPAKYTLRLRPIPPDLLPQTTRLGPALLELFERFELISEVQGDASLDRNQLGPSRFDQALLRIGSDVGYVEIVTRPGTDEVFSIDDSSQGPEAAEPFPSIYHYLLANAAVIYPSAVVLE
jgi:hypothetical protein